MIGLNIQTSFLTPPFGFALFYLRGVAPAAVRTVEMYRGVVAFICLQLLALVIVGNYPALVNYLPNRVSLLSETAPPPLNPRLQYCMEEYVGEQFAARGDDIRRAIETAKELDYSFVPKDLQRDLAKGFESAETTFDLLSKAKQAEADIDRHSVEYRPLHRQVRDIENDIQRLAAEIKIVTTAIQRGGPDHPRKAVREARLAGMKAEVEALQATIPGEWDEAHKAFLTYTKAERNARTKYRRATTMPTSRSANCC